MKKIPNLIRSTLLAAFFTVPVVLAEEIPEDMLLMDYAKCMQGCLDVEGKTACEILCGCSMSKFRADLDLETYEVMMREMLRDEVSPDNRTFLDETGKICVAEMDKLMGEFALEAPPTDQLPVPEEGEGGTP